MAGWRYPCAVRLGRGRRRDQRASPVRPRSSQPASADSSAATVALCLTGDERTVVGDPHARYFGTEVHGGELTTSDGARIGATGFEAWMARQEQGAAR